MVAEDLKRYIIKVVQTNGTRFLFITGMTLTEI